MSDNGAESPVTAVELMRGANRQLTIPPCVLTADDLRQLGQLLEAFAREASERVLAGMKPNEGQSAEAFEAWRKNVAKLLGLRASVQGANGEWKGGDRSVLDDLPDVLEVVNFDTALEYRTQITQLGPSHCVQLRLDFRRRPAFDLTNAADAAQEYVSQAVVNGDDTSWTHGVHSKLQKFFEERRSVWTEWLHGPMSYDVLLFVVGFPVTLLWLRRLDPFLGRFDTVFTPAVRVGALVYAVMLLLYAFRFTFNLACRVFPRMTGPRRGTRGGFREATVLIGAIGAWLSDILLNAFGTWVTRLFKN